MAVHSARAARALAHLPDHDPGLAALALWCQHRDGARTETEGTTIRYGSDFPVLPLHHQVGLAGHHILHVALRHSARMQALAQRLGGTFDPGLFNRAADALVNTTLLAAGHGLPRPAVTLEDLGLTDGPAAWDVERLYLHLLGQNVRSRGDGDEADDLRPESGGAAEASEHGDAAWQAHLTRAMAAGRAAGRGIGATTARLGDLPPPRLPWEVHLRRLLTRALRDDPAPSWRRPRNGWIAAEALARRAGGPVPVFEPGRARHRMVARIAVGLDTSGSISASQLTLFAAEIAGIARREGAEVHLLAFDEAVHEVRRIAPTGLRAALAALDLRRDGGTDFADVLARAAALDASITVILTDLQGETGPPPPGPVIWACPEAPARAPAFGKVLSMTR